MDDRAEAVRVHDCATVGSAMSSWAYLSQPGLGRNPRLIADVLRVACASTTTSLSRFERRVESHCHLDVLMLENRSFGHMLRVVLPHP
jgi:hypothetical protein